MLGNDVVDLLDVDARPETFRRRFDERVFSAEERRALAADASRALEQDLQRDVQQAHAHALRWAHWGAKEAAYKLIRQLDPTFVFSPGRLVARFEPAVAAPSSGSCAAFERRGRLEVVGGSSLLAAGLALRSFETQDFVHVVALPADGDWRAVAMAVEPHARTGAEPGARRVEQAVRASAAVRRLALDALARELEVDVQRLSIGARGRIPTVELDGRTLPVSLSLSHHGRFVAFAAAPRGRAALAAADERTAPGAATKTSGATAPVESKAFVAGGLRGFSRRREASVRRTSGLVGGPFASADTAWMVG